MIGETVQRLAKRKQKLHVAINQEHLQSKSNISLQSYCSTANVLQLISGSP